MSERKDTELAPIVAMAVAAIAEECHVKPDRVRVRSFRRVEDSPLRAYLAANGTVYQKYTLEDERR